MVVCAELASSWPFHPKQFLICNDFDGKISVCTHTEAHIYSVVLDVIGLGL